MRHLDQEGIERSKSFPDRQKKAADDFLVSTENDKRRGTFIDPNAGALTFRAYAEAWLESQTFEESTREAVAVRLSTALATYLGHADPAFTLRVYTHLMPSSEERTRRAIDGVFGPASPSADGMASASPGEPNTTRPWQRRAAHRTRKLRQLRTRRELGG